MSANNDDTLRQFCDVTGADEARSRFFLESSNWQLEVSLHILAFYNQNNHFHRKNAAKLLVAAFCLYTDELIRFQ